MALIPKPAADAKRDLVDYVREENQVPTFRDGADVNWYRAGISATRWNQAFPYQLRIVKLDGGTYKTVTDVKGATYTLPIPPESIEVETPFAINTSITLGGAIEEHNGAPIRMITLSGSLGVAFGRGRGQSAKAINLAESIFAGTVAAVSTTRTAINQLTNTSQVTFNVHAQSEFEDLADQGKLTGYYQARVLQQFIESYVELKKSAAPGARLYRLALCLWKDEAVYLVQPMDLRIRKAGNSPLEYLFSLQLKATKRVELERGVVQIAQKYKPANRDPSKLANLLRTVETARQTLQGARKIIQAVGGDINATIMTTMRELTLFAKDALSIPLALADLSESVIQDTKRAVVDLKSTRSAVSNVKSNFNNRFSQVSASLAELDGDLDSLAGETADSTDSSELIRLVPVNGGVSRSTHPAMTAFDNPADNYDFFSSVQVGDLNLPPATVSKIADERERVQLLSRQEYEEKRDTIKAAVAAISRSLGLSHTTYEKAYGLEPLPETAVDEASDEDFDVLFSLNRLVQELNRLAIANDNEPRALLDTLATVAGLAERSGIAFQVPRSKYAVPFPYGSTLEMLAQRYLHESNRWHEIAVLNGLKAPYVDEEGFTLPLLVNGEGSSVVVDDVSLLFVGQPVWIGSANGSRTRRRIRAIATLAPGQHLVSVDGDADLDKYLTLAEAYLFAFVPHTVNSQKLIYIPSDTEPRDDDFRTMAIPGVDSQDPFIAVGGADLLLTPKNDLVITPDGDTRWAVGLTNITQKLRLAMSVRTGTLNQHPEFGIPIEPGVSLAEVSAVDIIRSIEGMIADDPSFNGIRAAQVRIEGPTARVAVGVEVRGVDQVIPVSFEIRQ